MRPKQKMCPRCHGSMKLIKDLPENSPSVYRCILCGATAIVGFTEAGGGGGSGNNKMEILCELCGKPTEIFFESNHYISICLNHECVRCKERLYKNYTNT